MAVVARIVEQLGGQLRVDSKWGQGSRFSFLLPLTTDFPGGSRISLSSGSSSSSLALHSNGASRGSEIQDLVQALSANHMDDSRSSSQDRVIVRRSQSRPPPISGQTEITGSAVPLKAVKVDEFDLDPPAPTALSQQRKRVSPAAKRSPSNRSQSEAALPRLRILIVEVCTLICLGRKTRCWC